MKLTDTQAALIREYKARWNAPRDWSSANMDAGTSSVIKWLEWAASPAFRLERFTRALACHPAGTVGPTLAQIRWKYDRLTEADNAPPESRIVQRPVTVEESVEIARRFGFDLSIAKPASKPKPLQPTFTQDEETI